MRSKITLSNSNITKHTVNKGVHSGLGLMLEKTTLILSKVILEFMSGCLHGAGIYSTNEVEKTTHTALLTLSELNVTSVECSGNGCGVYA